MIRKIKNKIESELTRYLKTSDDVFLLKKNSPVLYDAIKEFLSRNGKRIRSVLFVVGYLGYSNKPARGLYQSALSMELAHNFMLIHDDIIDNSDLRRGLPSMHRLMDHIIKKNRDTKFGGKDLAIVVGDIIYAMAIKTILAIDEDRERKERALQKMAETMVFTGMGEFIELLYSAKKMSAIDKNEIYKIYDLKTGRYTFCSPVSIGASLAGAGRVEISKLSTYGILLGRAFQIRDDILDMFAEESQIGKSSMTDIKEAKKTLLVWHAYKNADTHGRKTIEKIMSGKDLDKRSLRLMRKIITQTGSLDYAIGEVRSLSERAAAIASTITMKEPYKKALLSYQDNFLAMDLITTNLPGPVINRLTKTIHKSIA